MKKLLITLLLVSTTWVTFAQQTNDLTEEEIAAFKVQCQERVDALQMGLEIIADKQQSPEIKDHYVKILPEMFLGDGNPWTDAKGGKHDAVKMQVSSIAGGKERINDVPLKVYLSRLRNLSYSEVKITKAKTCMVSNLYKINETTYMGTCTFFQYFTGKSGEEILYQDYSQKDIDVYIQRVEDGFLGSHWDMKFGDVNVSVTRKISN